jgi:2-amino-4-hydroxy-6-hydroxymethyldihydropteridine diphosphokinase
VLDIDILAYHDVIIGPPGMGLPQSHSRRLKLPHPGLADRAFVLHPLAEIAPLWHHPITGLTPVQMLHQLHSSHGGEVLGSGFINSI